MRVLNRCSHSISLLKTIGFWVESSSSLASMYRIDTPSIIQLQFDSFILLMKTRKLKMAGVDEPAKEESH